MYQVGLIIGVWLLGLAFFKLVKRIETYSDALAATFMIIIIAIAVTEIL